MGVVPPTGGRGGICLLSATTQMRLKFGPRMGRQVDEKADMRQFGSARCANFSDRGDLNRHAPTKWVGVLELLLQEIQDYVIILHVRALFCCDICCCQSIICVLLGLLKQNFSFIF